MRASNSNASGLLTGIVKTSEFGAEPPLTGVVAVAQPSTTGVQPVGGGAFELPTTAVFVTRLSAFTAISTVIVTWVEAPIASALEFVHVTIWPLALQLHPVPIPLP